jgi:hypothetical protein
LDILLELSALKRLLMSTLSQFGDLAYSAYCLIDCDYRTGYRNL